MMNLVIISLEILVILQETLTRNAPNLHPREYTQAAYYLPFDNEEYSWTKSNRIETRKKHRKKYYDNSVSAEMDYDPKRLQCKCTCKRKFDTKLILEFEQNDPCCNCFSKSDADNRDHITPTQYPNEENNGIYRPTLYPNENNNGIFRPIQYPNEENNGRYGPIQYPNEENNGIYRPVQYPNEENNGIYGPIQYPNEENNGIYRPTQYPNGENNGIYMPTQFPLASYPSIIYPTFDQSLIDKIFPWLTQGVTQITKIDNNGQTDKGTATKDQGEKYSTSADKDKSSTRDNRDNATSRDDREKASSNDDREKASSSDDKDIPSTRDNRDKTSISDDKDKSNTKHDRDKPSTSDDKDRSSTKDDRDKPSTSHDKDRPSTKEDRDKSSTSNDKNRPTRDDIGKASTKDEDDDDDRGIEGTGVSVDTPLFLSYEITIGTTLSTYPYVKSEHLKKRFHYLPKKKKCFRDKCVRKEYTNRKIGRYFEGDLVERPTIPSYLNINRRRSNVPRKLYKVRLQHGIVRVPSDKLISYENERITQL